MKLAPLLFAFSLAVSSLAQGPETPQAATILALKRAQHPRILATAGTFEHLRDLAGKNPPVAKLVEQLRADADALLSEPPSKYEIPDGKRLLATSRRVLERALTLGLTFQLTADRRYLERLWQELDAAANFRDWNPSHFLDTAEMTAAFAIGLDWLHAQWTPEQRMTLRKAIVTKGLTPSLDFYRNNRWWVAVEHNWNQVCNGGMTLGALAVMDDEPVLAGEILAGAIASIPRAMKHFAPDGAWGEGPVYWNYATKYNVLMLAALDTAFGKDFGLSQVAGFSKTADFPIQTTGPLGRSFNFADASDALGGGPQLLWFATKFNVPGWAAWRIERFTSDESMFHSKSLDLLWGADWLARKPSAEPLPKARQFHGVEVVTMRNAWDPDATFIGFKGGDNKVNHGHLDLGSFVLDARGRRWAMDLGPDDYNLPGYFGKTRWNFYRCRAEGHNTLVINPGADPDQNPAATAKIVRFESSDQQSFAIADLSEAYAKAKVKRALRGIALHGKSVLVQDEVTTTAPSEVWWFMHTEAEISAENNTAVLKMDGRSLKVRILEPSGARFEFMPAQPMPTSPQLPKQQLKSRWQKADVSAAKKLAIHLKDVTQTTIAVAFEVEESGIQKTQPLSEWSVSSR